MKPRETLFLMLKYSPKSFRNKEDALNRMFLCGCNGYEWTAGGELQRLYWDRAAKQHKLEAGPFRDAQERALERNLQSEVSFQKTFGRQQVYPARGDDEVEFLLDLPLDACMTLDPVAKCSLLYPAYPAYANLSRFPDTITWEWGMAVREYAQFLLEVPPSGGTHDTARRALEALGRLQ